MTLKELDADKSGDVDKEEFIAALEAKQVDPESEDVIKYAFDRFDTDGSGYLSHAELEVFLLRCRVLTLFLTPTLILIEGHS